MRIVIGVAVILVLLLVVGVFLIDRYLQTPEFKELVLTSAGEAVGSNLEIDSIEVSVFRGIELQGVVLANPSGFSGEFLTADSLILRHRLLPLLRKQVQIDRLSLEKPTLKLIQGEDERWNFQQLQVRESESGLSSDAAADESLAVTSRFDITLSQLSVSDGEISMLSKEGQVLTQIRDVDLRSSVSLVDEKLVASGTLSLETVNFGDSLFVRSLTAPVAISAEELRLSPIRGKLADGIFLGEIILTIAKGFRYLLDIEVVEAEASKLLEEAKIAFQMSGTLRASVMVEGTGGLSTLVGKGSAAVVDGKLAGLPAQDLLANLLQVTSLHEIEFEECLVEFTLADNILETPVIRLISPLLQVTGKGRISLDQKTLDHDMTLALSKEMLATLPGPLLRVFNQRDDDFYTLDFRLWGPYNAPRTDLQERLVQGAAERLLEEGLKGLKKLFQ